MMLEREFAAFRRKLPELVGALKGKFVLIHGDDVSGSWDTEDAAYTAGCQWFGVEPFLVMLVDADEKPIPLRQDVVAYAGDSPGA